MLQNPEALRPPTDLAQTCAEPRQGRDGKAEGGRRIALSKDEPRSQRGAYHRVRSGLTQKVSPKRGDKPTREKP